METALSNHAHIYGDIETEAHMHDVIQSECLSESALLPESNACQRPASRHIKP